jgi:hypothetical protein
MRPGSVRANTELTRRRIARRQGFPGFPRAVSKDRRRPDTALSCAVFALARAAAWHLRRFLHESADGIETRTCGAHCWSIRGCFGRRDGLEAQPSQLRQRVQPEQTYVELGQP